MTYIKKAKKSNYLGALDLFEQEIWKPVIGYEGLYEVSNLGNVQKVKGKKPIKGSTQSKNYLQVTLSKNKKARKLLVHILVASSFLGLSKLKVNHKDSNKKNNRLDNLEYVTQRDNVIHGRLSLKKKNKTSKYVGVFFDKRVGKYVSQIRIKGKSKKLGYFTSELEAHTAYKNALSELNEYSIYAVQEHI
jgi:NUMOD4 motif/HNH endonuclease